MSGGRLFSDAWYRVADLRVALRPTVRSHRQHFRGEPWYVLRDPFNNRFFRVRPEAWELIARLDSQRTVEEVWLEELERNPEHAPGQEDVVELLSQLSRANLLYFDNAADAAGLFKRYQKRRDKERRAKLLSVISFRLPLLDPDRLLRDWAPRFRFLFSSAGLIFWLLLLASAVVPLADRGGELLDQANGVLAPGNLLWLYLAMALVKMLHELGHGLVCRYFGGEVHTLGVMFIVFMPLPYVDATSSWTLRSRNQRALIGAAGMIVELAVAAVAAWVWAYTAPGIINSVAYNIMFVASASTLLFNANPLLRFDGYYVLSDLMDVPNLFARSRSQLVYWFERFLAGCRHLPFPAYSGQEAGWLTVFGVFSIVYRLVVFVGITLFVADSYLLLGVLMAVSLIVMTLVIPPFKLLSYLASNSRITGHRKRAAFAALGLLLAIGSPLTLWPVEDGFRADGVLEAKGFREVTSAAEGYVVATAKESGSQVTAGELLVQLDNPTLALRIQQAEAQLLETRMRIQQARSLAWSEVEPLIQREKEAQTRLSDLQARLKDLQVVAPISGVWIAPQLKDRQGDWTHRGASLGRIVDDRAFQMVAVVKQEAASRVFTQGEKGAEVRLTGREGTVLEVASLNVVPFQHQELPSAALGWKGGGEQQVDMGDERGTRSSEPFFLVRAALSVPEDFPLWHGQTGVMRVVTGQEVLLTQWLRELRQLLQRRFQL